MSEMPPGLTDAAKRALAARATGDGPGLLSAMDVITSYGDLALYAVCRGWAAFVAGAIPGEGFAELEVETVDGQPVDPSNLPPSAARDLWAARFITASANGDEDTTMALFRAAQQDPERLGKGVFSLLDAAAQIMRQILERNIGNA